MPLLAIWGESFSRYHVKMCGHFRVSISFVVFVGLLARRIADNRMCVRRWWMFCSFAGPFDTAYLEESAMNTARCRICWQPLPPLQRQCARCGHIDTLRVTNIFFERFVKVAGLVAIGLVVWAVIRHGVR